MTEQPIKPWSEIEEDQRRWFFELRKQAEKELQRVFEKSWAERKKDFEEDLNRKKFIYERKIARLADLQKECEEWKQKQLEFKELDQFRNKIIKQHQEEIEIIKEFVNHKL